MKGLLIAIEGVDASGKHTQARLLFERLKKEGFGCSLVSFPRYETFWGRLVKKYLKGGFGSLKEVKPEFASLLYSLDRFDAMPWIELEFAKGKIVVCDRYIASNVAHQAAKFSGKERGAFIRWIEIVEGRLPKPALTIFLDLPVPVSAGLMNGRARERDIHELDLKYLEAVRAVYLFLSKRPGWFRVGCSSGKGIKPKGEIHGLIWRRVQEYL